MLTAHEDRLGDIVNARGNMERGVIRQDTGQSRRHSFSIPPPVGGIVGLGREPHRAPHPISPPLYHGGGSMSTEPLKIR